MVGKRQLGAEKQCFHRLRTHFSERTAEGTREGMDSEGTQEGTQEGTPFFSALAAMEECRASCGNAARRGEAHFYGEVTCTATA